MIELIVVVVVIVLLSLIVILNISSVKDSATKITTDSDMKNLQTAIDMYILENNGELPTEIKPIIGLPQPLKVDYLYPKFNYMNLLLNCLTM